MTKKSASLFCILITAITLTACGLGRSDIDYLDSAKESIADNDPSSAIIQLKNALQKNPELGEAWFLLGKLQYEQSDYLDAEKNLNKAKELGVADNDLYPPLSRVLLALGKYEELQQLSLEWLSDTNKAAVLAAQGWGLIAQYQVEEASPLIEKAYALDDHSPFVLTARASLALVMNEDAEQVRQYINEAMAIDENYALAWSVLGDLETRENNLPEAEKNYGKALENNPRDINSLLKRASRRFAQGKIDEAQTDVDTLLSFLPKSPDVLYLQGLIDFQKRNYEQAIVDFTTPLYVDERFPLAVLYSAMSHMELGNSEQALSLARRFYQLQPNNVTGRKVLASLELREERYSEVEDLLWPVVSNDSQDSASMEMLATALLKQGRPVEATDLLQRMVEISPDSAKAHLQLGAGYLAQGNQEQGEKQIRKALELDPAYDEAYAMLGVSYLQQKEFQKAIELAEEFATNKPNSPAPYIMSGQIYAMTKNADQALESYTKAIEVDPGNPFASSFLIDKYVSEKNYAEATSLAENVLSKHPDNLSALVKLSSIKLIQGDEEGMVELLNRAIDAHPESATPRLQLARYYIAKADTERAKGLLESLTRPPNRNAEAVELMAMSLLLEKDFEPAKSILVNNLEGNEKNANLHFLLSRAYAGLNDTGNMEAQLDKVLALEPEHYLANLASARLYLVQNERDKFNEKLTWLKKEHADNLDVIKLEAEWLNLNNKPAEALGKYQKAYDLTPNTETVIALAKQKNRVKDLEGTEKLLVDWIEKHGDDIAARHALAAYYDAAGNPEKANGQYLAIIGEFNGQDAVALNNLAWNLRTSNPPQALEYSQKAMDIAPQNVAIADTYALVLLENKQLEKARRTIERVLELSPNNPSALYHKALIERASGNKAAALDAVEQALASGKSFKERSEAEELKETIETS